MAIIEAIDTENIRFGSNGVNILIGLTVTDDGDTFEAVHCLTPDDHHGFSPMLRQWLIEHEGEYTIKPYAPPVLSDEQRRAAMPSLTSRQFWLAANAIGISKDAVLAQVAMIVDPAEREALRIEAAETSSFSRTHPAVDELATAMGITPAQLDDLWNWGAAL